MMPPTAFANTIQWRGLITDHANLLVLTDSLRHQHDIGPYLIRGLPILIQNVRVVIAEVVNKLDACVHGDEQCDDTWTRACTFERTVEGFTIQVQSLASRYENESLGGDVAAGGSEVEARPQDEGEALSPGSGPGPGQEQGHRRRRSGRGAR